MPRVEIPGIDVALLTGPLVLGYMFAFGLYGILIVQVYMYSESFPRDRPVIKALGKDISPSPQPIRIEGGCIVWSMFLLESIFTLFTTIAAWNQYGPGWGDTDTLLTIDWAWGPLPALNGILAGMAQSFYIWRIYSLSKSIYAPIFIALFTVSFYYGIVVSIEGRGVDKLFALSPEITALARWFDLVSYKQTPRLNTRPLGSAACDMLITLSLVWVFSRQKKKTNFSRTSGIINRLIRYSVETGAVTTIGAVIEVTLWLTSRQWNIHFIFFLVIGKLYSNMLMATLNARCSNVPQRKRGWWVLEWPVELVLGGEQ
ncbi:hypothetical protein B0H16DRAFT_1719816 [Mycena metata]|uniref:DUF6534 domain-containing protein n=1 Tax=Mycena metata TaxID=1033252 RepID=A0AAD7JDM6_9AGAR|nr:hypothetical protein B0H16DRAFT_1719816 [Mycena metata]